MRDTAACRFVNGLLGNLFTASVDCATNRSFEMFEKESHICYEIVRKNIENIERNPRRLSFGIGF